MCTLVLWFRVREKKMTPVLRLVVTFMRTPVWGFWYTLKTPAWGFHPSNNGVSEISFWKTWNSYKMIWDSILFCTWNSILKFQNSFAFGFTNIGTFGKQLSNALRRRITRYWHTYSNLFELLIVILCENDQICPWHEIGIKVFYLDKLHTFLNWSRYFFKWF